MSGALYGEAFGAYLLRAQFLLEMMKKDVSSVVATPDTEVMEVEVDNEMYEKNYAEAAEWKAQQEKMRKWEQLTTAVTDLVTDQIQKEDYFSEDEETVFTEKKLKRCNAALDLATL